jgi:hypothetical protein
MANFLDASVIPGDTVPKHHHRKLLVILTILVLVALAVLGYMLYGKSFSTPKIDYVPTSSKVDPTVELLKKNAAPLNEIQKQESAKLLQTQAKPLTNAEKQAAAELLKKLSK